MKHLKYITLVMFVLWSCDETTPKPRGLLRLDYNPAKYRIIDSIRPYKIIINDRVDVLDKKSYNMELFYPRMKATIYLNYHRMSGNLEALLRDAQRFTYEHIIKADGIFEQAYEDIDNRVYGMMYSVRGNAASQTQFYLTDSIDHFISGSLYFYAEPNYDSIFPSVRYIDKDIHKLVETLRWK